MKRVIKFRLSLQTFVWCAGVLAGCGGGDSTGEQTPAVGIAPAARADVSATGDIVPHSGTRSELPLPVARETFYVSSSLGDDRFSGALPEPNTAGDDGPKASLDAAVRLVNRAAPGTHVLLRRGDTWSARDSLEFDSAIGTADDPVVLGAYGSGAESLDDEGASDQPTIVSRHEASTLVVRGQADRASHYFRIDDLRFTHAGAVDGQHAIFVGESYYPLAPHHVTFSKLTVEGNGAGMTLYGDHHLVQDSRIANNNFGMGIYARGNNLVIRHNEFENNGLPPPDVFVHSLYISKSNGVLFEHNVVHSATDGLKVRRTHDSVFRHNTFHGIEAIGIHLGGDREDGARNNRIESNHFYGNATDIVIKSESGTQVVPVDGLVIANNIHHSGTDGFIDFGHHVLLTDVPARNVSILNNLVYETGRDGGIRIDNAGSHIRCANNIVTRFSAAKAYDLDDAVLRSSNLEVASRKAFDALELVNPTGLDFRPTAKSTAIIDRGADVRDLLGADYDGNTRPRGESFDIGPYEY